MVDTNCLAILKKSYKSQNTRNRQWICSETLKLNTSYSRQWVLDCDLLEGRNRDLLISVSTPVPREVVHTLCNKHSLIELNHPWQRQCSAHTHMLLHLFQPPLQSGGVTWSGSGQWNMGGSDVCLFQARPLKSFQVSLQRSPPHINLEDF